LDKASRNDKIKAVVLRVDSPGGSGLASDMIWREVALVRQRKPVVVSMSSTAASGGYFISMGADGIVAEPGTITGSIGVLTGKFVTRKLWDWTGINYVPMKRGQNADLFSAYVPFSPDQEKLVVSLMQSFYKDFVTKAAQGRNKSYEEIDKVAQGRIWSGEDALKLGLVDQLGGLDEAITMAKSKAKIGKDEKVRLQVYPRALTVFEALFKGGLKDAKEDLAEQDLPEAVKSPLRQLKAMAPLASEPFLVYMPERIEAK
jgi:protease-4